MSMQLKENKTNEKFNPGPSETSLAGLKVGLVSLGCAKNLVDSEVMLGLLEKAGCLITAKAAEAEVLIVNTCGFIESAQREAVNTILELGQYKLNGSCRALIVTGCLVQRFAADLARELPEADALLGAGEFNQIVTVIQRVLGGEKVQAVGQPLFLYSEAWPRKLVTPSHYAYIKVAEGCDNCCTYCTIPEIRGRYRSRTISSVRREAETLVQQGVKELILIAQDTTRFGEDREGTPQLARLLRELAEIPDLHWLRWMYGYPTRITPELIRVMAKTPKICTYVDLPLQHIDQDVLARMNRPADPQQTRRVIAELREAMPDLALRTSFIVGFPGETEAAFSRLLEFMEEICFDRVGAFTYSPEAGTRAAKWPDSVPEEIKTERYERLMACQQRISQQKNQAWLGRTVTVLMEGITEDPRRTQTTGTRWLGYGRTTREAPEVDGLVYFRNPSNHPLTVGNFVPVIITQADHYDLIGVVDSEFAQ